jgi:thiamine transport system permease protein
MAGRAVALGLPRWPGGLVAVALVAVLAGTVLALARHSGGMTALEPQDWVALRFTLTQAFLSSVLSVGLAVPVARALARRRFRGRAALLTLLGAPFILPIIAAILGLVAVFGRNGLVSLALGWVGLPPLSIYGLHGVVLAHVFLNLPLATRLILQGWAEIPAEQFRLAATLNAPVGRLLERPMLRAVLPGAVMAIFLICMTSFAVALTLGGGPAATTLELAVYQALRFDFDPGHAAALALLQTALCLAAAAAAFAVQRPAEFTLGLDRAALPMRTGWADPVWIGLAALFLVLPLAMLLRDGLPHLAQLPVSVWAAAARSVAVALAAAGLAVSLALALALAGGLLVQVAGALPLALSSLVLGTGLFVLLRPVLNPVDWALPLTALVNAVMCLPFAYRVLAPDVARITATYGRLATALAMPAGARLRLVYLPRLRRPLGFALGLSAALAMGDLGVVALFSGTGQETLPMLVYQLLGAYRTGPAAAAVLLLAGLSLGLFWLFDKGGRGDADA